MGVERKDWREFLKVGREVRTKPHRGDVEVEEE